jgi:Domain of unknown function (DUF4166)/Saccharopine dehydrogenase NADP binding domain
MSEIRLRILIVGGYGIFGGRLVQLLAEEPRLTLVVAGRSQAKVQAFCASLHGQATLIAAAFDRDGDTEAQLRALAPDLVVDTSGPFQVYGDNPYALVKAALALKFPYLDLADGSDFVAGIAQFDARAKELGIFVLSGVSSFPVLTAAVCRHLARDLASVQTITGGIAPSPYAGVGLNVIRAISSYAGKDVAVVRGGRAAVGHGLTETMRATIAPPGRLPLRNTLFSLVDVPDLTVLPQQWPHVQSVWMGAGPVPEILHRALIALSWLVRLRLLPPLAFLAPLFHRAINTLRWGEHRGGMVVKLVGTAHDGTNRTRSWHLLAEGSDGPLIPAMAIEAIVRKVLAGQTPQPGARSAVGDLELADYDTMFARRTIYTGVRETRAGVDPPLYRRVLGAAFDELPKPIRDMHAFSSVHTASGVAEVERGTNPLSRLIGWIFGFPSAARAVPVQVQFTAKNGREIWRRSFGDKSFSSEQFEGTGRSEYLLVERFGIFSFAMALVWAEKRLSLVVRRWSCLGIPLPLSLAPGGEAFEFVRDGKFHFHVEIKLPLAGLIVRYRGSLVPPQTVTARETVSAR